MPMLDGCWGYESGGVRAFVVMELPVIMSDAVMELMLDLKMCVRNGIR